MENLELIRECIFRGDRDGAIQYTKSELDKNTPWSDILEKAMIPAMDQIGEEFSKGNAYLPELIAAGDAMTKAFQAIKEKHGGSEIKQRGTVVIGTIFEDVHDIGKNIVKMNFEGAGFRVIDLGTDVKPEQFVEACRKNSADLVGISSLLSTTMLNIERAIEEIRESGLKVKIMVGGNPVTEEFAAKIGADGYAPDGYQAVQKAKRLLNIN
jgi:5-methyltetrahydrofolate--homocysteine methyltransferase